MSPSRACDLCGSRHSRPRHEVSGYHIVDCAECGLCYVQEEVAAEEIERYYGRDYFTGGQAQAYADYLGHAEKRKAHFRSLLPSLRRHLQPGPVRALDVGCATGCFLEVAREEGWRARGVEISSFAVAEARQRGFDVVQGRLEDVGEDGAYDLVTLWDVIEHLADPRATLERASRLLRPGGLVVLATGDISGATARLYGRSWALLAPPGHLFYFSRRTLFAMLRRCGFAPLAWQSDGAFLLNPVDGGEGGSLPPLVERLHRNRWVNAVLRRLRLGSIITVYARRCGQS